MRIASWGDESGGGCQGGWVTGRMKETTALVRDGRLRMRGRGQVVLVNTPVHLLSDVAVSISKEEHRSKAQCPPHAKAPASMT